MKNIFYASLILLFAITSCIKEQPKPEAGNIPGMGETPGEIEIATPFELPDGISIEGSIVGLSGGSVSVPEETELKSLNTWWRYRGSGKQVQCGMTFRNDKSDAVDIEIPGGCVFENQESDGQHGICLQTIRIHVLGNSQVQLKFYLYCLNEGRPASRIQDTYIIRGVTGSQSFADLVNSLKNKRIDISMFSDNMNDYDVIADKIQQCVWKLTNSIYGINKTDWDYINYLDEMD
ncbi:MAG: hypothetical protein JW717_12775 [Marinilabiliaceae bacterium]|nr:hypothetical protein [Marinilabiliaceae bacterium]